MGVSVVLSFPHPVRLGTSPEISGRFSAAMGGTSGKSPSKRTFISSRSSSILSAKVHQHRNHLFSGDRMLCKVGVEELGLVDDIPSIPDVGLQLLVEGEG